jgi:hypothetical protein
MSAADTEFMPAVGYPRDRQQPPVSVKQPTPAQKERRARLRRFNGLVLYLPLTLVTAAWIVLIVALIWLAVAGEWFAMDTNQAYYRGLISAVADIFTMLMLTPLLILCSLPVLAALAYPIYLRRRRAAKTESAESLPLFWRAENIITSIRDGVDHSIPRVARPIISAHAFAALVRRFLIEVKQVISQEILRNDDHG